MVRHKRRVTIHTKRKYLILSLIGLFVFIGIAYSYLNKELNILGNITVKKYRQTLYNVLKKEAEINGLAKEYTGSHQDSFDASLSTKKIYHWYATNDAEGTQILDKNNVIFANHCWQMIRTTDTGGVKMIYNGQVENNQCLNTRSDQNGYTVERYQELNDNYWYGTDYIYDSSTSTFTIGGETEQKIWNNVNWSDLIGKYTCLETTQSATCSSIYLVLSYYDENTAFLLPIEANYSHYSEFGYSVFNKGANSPADVGYMYNTRYISNIEHLDLNENITSYKTIITNYWYADSVSYNSNTNKYSLTNPYKITSTNDYPNLVGKYTFTNQTQNYTDTNVYYIIAVSGNRMYYITLSSGNNLAYYNDSYTYGDSYTDNGNGTYTINNPTTINKFDWYSNYDNLKNKYVCINAVNNTCNRILHIVRTTATGFSYINSNDAYKYSKSFTYDGSKYTLDNNTAVSLWDTMDSTSIESFNNAHYTCWNDSGECSTISYIYYNSPNSPSNLNYIELTDGKNIEDALSEMLTNDNVNSINSAIKTGIEAWYKRNVLPFDSNVEDTIFCNDRSISALNGWNPNGGELKGYLQFKHYETINDLSCANITDQFSTYNNKAKLDYKVGMMTAPEMNLLNNANAKKTDMFYWLLTPSYFMEISGGGKFIDNDGNDASYEVYNLTCVRPAISLKPETEYLSGDGSMANPYIVKTGE